MNNEAKIGKMDGSVIVSDKTIEFFQYSNLDNPYLWSIEYFNDWRCVLDYLKEQARRREI